MARKRPRTKATRPTPEASPTPSTQSASAAAPRASTESAAPAAAAKRGGKPAILRVQEQAAGSAPAAEHDAHWPAKPIAIALFAIAVAVVATTRALPMHSAAIDERPDLRFDAANGKQYPYLIGQDSFSWVRKAANYVDHGSPCDVVQGDECRDLLRHAPVGSEMPYADSLHIYAIGWMHQALRVFDAKMPIEASAFWLQAFVGTLGVLPAWMVGRALGGMWGGLFAALLIGLARNQFERTLGGDNDVWNLVLPIFGAWGLLAALDGTVRWKRLACAAGAGMAIGLHAWIWSGWLFGFAVLVATGVGAVAWALLRSFIPSERAQGRARAGMSLAIVATFVATTALVTVERTDDWRALGKQIGVIDDAPAPATLPKSGGDELKPEFPDGLRNVGELRVLTLEQLIDRLGGRFAIFGALLGLVLLLIPATRSTGFERAVGFSSALVLALAVFGFEASLTALALCTAVPVLLLFGSRVLEEKPRPFGIHAALLLVAWVTAALYQSTNGQRFILLAVAPIGLACAAAAGQLVRYVHRATREDIPAWVAAVALTVGVGVISNQGVALARHSLPKLNDTWADSLVELREESSPNSIVFVWWQYGYWVEHLAQRGVAVDGSSLLKRISHWLGRALLAGDEKQSVGFLRMLACGSDAAPEPEGSRGAYERLRAAGASGFEAYDLVVLLAGMDRPEAENLLRTRGYEAGERESILEATHCAPPPAYVVLSDRQSRQSDWVYQGNWDTRRAVVAHKLAPLPDDEALAKMTGELGIARDKAVPMLRAARAAKSDEAADRFIAPSAMYYGPWMRCRAAEGGRNECAATGPSSKLEGLTYSNDAPERGTVRIRRGAGTRNEPLDAAVIVDRNGVRSVQLTGNEDGGSGALIDTTRQRVMLGTPVVIRSLFTRLMFLEQTRLKHFQRIADRRGRDERVATYRIRW